MRFYMKVSDLNPHIRYARIHKAYISYKKEISKCYDCRIFYFKNVKGSIIANEIKYNICNNTAVYLPPATEYVFSVEVQGEIIVLDFDLINKYEQIKNSLGTATKESFDKSIMPIYNLPAELSSPIIKIIPQICRMLEDCAKNFIIKEPFYRENSSALLKLCLIGFVKQYEQLSHSALCENILAYIHKNFANTDLTNEYISKEFNYHPYHLSRLIKQETGKNLHQYLIYYRLQMAKNFLLTTQYAISHIAWRCGFNSAAYFTKIFKENTNMTPKEYRNLQIHIEI